MKNKRSIAVFLAIVMSLFCFVGCGTKQNVKDALQGTWVAQWTTLGRPISRYYQFKGDTYTTGGKAYFGEVDTETGTYEIKDSVIHLIPDDGSDGRDLEYTYNETTGTVTLWWSDDVQFQKGQIDVNYSWFICFFGKVENIENSFNKSEFFIFDNI